MRKVNEFCGAREVEGWPGKFWKIRGRGKRSRFRGLVSSGTPCRVYGNVPKARLPRKLVSQCSNLSNSYSVTTNLFYRREGSGKLEEKFPKIRGRRVRRGSEG